jgi:hypothetical protein
VMHADRLPPEVWSLCGLIPSRRPPRSLPEDEIMISVIIGMVFAIFVLEVAVGMWIGWWLFPSQPKRSMLPRGAAPSSSPVIHGGATHARETGR